MQCSVSTSPTIDLFLTPGYDIELAQEGICPIPGVCCAGRFILPEEQDEKPSTLKDHIGTIFNLFQIISVLK